MRCTRVVFVLMTCACALASRAQTDATSEYVGQVLTQRQSVCGAQLVYDADGNRVSGEVGSWTTCAEISVQKVEANGNDLVIQGLRKLLLYDNQNRRFLDIFDLIRVPKDARSLMIKLPKGKQLNLLLDEQPVTVEIRRADGWNDDAIKAAMERVFLAPSETLADAAPQEWKQFLCTDKDANRSSACQQPEQPAPVHRVGGPVSPPHVLVSPDPPYTEEARLAHYEGTTVLWVVIGSDGTAQDVRIVRPIGLGLDESAIKAVKQWRFDPAKQGKQPVSVQINVEVNFRLY